MELVRYSRRNSGNHMLSEEETKLTVMLSQDKMLLLYHVASSHRDLVSTSIWLYCILLCFMR